MILHTFMYLLMFMILRIRVFVHIFTYARDLIHIYVHCEHDFYVLQV